MGVCDLVRCGPITLVQSRCVWRSTALYFTIWPRFGTTGYLRFVPIYSNLVRFGQIWSDLVIRVTHLTDLVGIAEVFICSSADAQLNAEHSFPRGKFPVSCCVFSCLDKHFFTFYLLLHIVWSVMQFLTTVIQRLDDFVSVYSVYATCIPGPRIWRKARL